MKTTAESLALKHSIAIEIATRGYAIDALPNDVNVNCAFDLAERIVERMGKELEELNKQNEVPDDLREVLLNALRKAST